MTIAYRSMDDGPQTRISFRIGAGIGGELYGVVVVSDRSC